MGAKDGVLLPFEGAEVTTTEFDESVSQINRFMHENGDKAVCKIGRASCRERV